jgi:tetratricopeptide (TPR) repeat protein
MLCKYGVEYVEDPVKKTLVPTCNRAQFTSVLADIDYQKAVEYADEASRVMYETEARAIEAIQKGILEISKKEEPFDIFICYKETDAQGQRTKDSVLAHDIYHQLTKEGYKVFFARLTLEKLLGHQYEPYIFAALNSAKIMLVVGTNSEYFNAVWVKNEWSRFLTLMKDDKDKYLIPCFKDMNVYDLPNELSILQSQDMGKLGFIQDLLHGINKILKPSVKSKEPDGPMLPPDTPAGPGIKTLYERALIFLEDGEFSQAREYCTRILDIDPKYGPAYMAELCADLGVRREADLPKSTRALEEVPSYAKALRFTDVDTQNRLKAINTTLIKSIME